MGIIMSQESCARSNRNNNIMVVKNRKGVEKSSETSSSSTPSSPSKPVPNSDPQDSPHHVNGDTKRSRRTNSMDRAAEITGKENKERSVQPDKPCHRPQDSLFSSTSGYTNYRGLLNLCIIILVLSNARVALENIIKYGILVDPSSWIRVASDPTIVPSIQLTLGLNTFILSALWIEKYLLATGVCNELLGGILYTVNALAVVISPAYIVYTKECHPIGSTIALSFAAVVFLKLTSYHMVNYWCRKDLLKRFRSKSGINKNVLYNKLQRFRSFSRVSTTGSESNLLTYMNGAANLTRRTSLSDSSTDGSTIVQYPDNLTVKDMYYFVAVPSLCYELNFPRSQRIRKRFLLRRGLEALFLFQLNLGLIQQWMIPIISNSAAPLQQMNYAKIVERLLKLAIPNHIIWLIWFYWFFHSCSNFWAEILRFADREFYRDWWNSNSVQYFWANWNIPVHRWCLRHLYKPLLSHGVSRMTASTAVFFVSAFFHEYLVSVPLKMFRIWAFSGMILQIPFAMMVTKHLQGYPQWANAAVWMSLIIGQPLAIIMYYHDYYIATLTTNATSV